LLVLRELLGGPRRYSDLRAELPGIATNLLTDRLRGLEQAGLVVRTELQAAQGSITVTVDATAADLIPRDWERLRHNASRRCGG
jgi:DNA-binding HxlR family transcriptional regulator